VGTLIVCRYESRKGLKKILPVTRYIESHSFAWGRKHSRRAHLERKF